MRKKIEKQTNICKAYLVKYTSRTAFISGNLINQEWKNPHPFLIWITPWNSAPSWYRRNRTRHSRTWNYQPIAFTCLLVLLGFFLVFLYCSTSSVSSTPSKILICILHNVHHSFPEVLTRRICLTIKSFFSWWSSPLLLVKGFFFNPLTL